MNNDFVKVAETKDIQPSTMKAVDLASEESVLLMSKEIIMP